MNDKIYSILKRFAKGMIAGFISGMSVVSIAVPSVWGDYKAIFGALLMAGSFGALNGLLLALQKWASWKDEL